MHLWPLSNLMIIVVSYRRISMKMLFNYFLNHQPLSNTHKSNGDNTKVEITIYLSLIIGLRLHILNGSILDSRHSNAEVNATGEWLSSKGGAELDGGDTTENGILVTTGEVGGRVLLVVVDGSQISISAVACQTQLS